MHLTTYVPASALCNSVGTKKDFIVLRLLGPDMTTCSIECILLLTLCVGLTVFVHAQQQIVVTVEGGHARYHVPVFCLVKQTQKDAEKVLQPLQWLVFSKPAKRVSIVQLDKRTSRS
ncbi:hypothetical protein VNO77_32888 [Canavalia gladiata]|uniref:Uncharacterized protein n=1 Tax=Canavalia gladiata TaxID=3824 RepID=A0AAN9KDP2_CANGL